MEAGRCRKYIARDALFFKQGTSTGLARDNATARSVNRQKCGAIEIIVYNTNVVLYVRVQMGKTTVYSRQNHSNIKTADCILENRKRGTEKHRKIGVWPAQSAVVSTCSIPPVF